MPVRSAAQTLPSLRTGTEVNTAAAEVVDRVDGLTFFAVDLLSDATTVRGPPRTQGDVQSRPWMAGGRMW